MKRLNEQIEQIQKQIDTHTQYRCYNQLIVDEQIMNILKYIKNGN